MCRATKPRSARGGARRIAILAAAKWPATFFEYTQTNQTSDGWDRWGAEKSGRVHDAGVAWVNRSAGRSSADALAIALTHLRPGSGAIGAFRERRRYEC